MADANDRIDCPNCGARIPITATLQEQVSERIRKEIQEQQAEAERNFKAKERHLSDREKELANAQASIDSKVEERIQAESARLSTEAERRAKQALSTEMDDLRSQLTETTTHLGTARKTELELRRRERELDEAKKTLELDVERRLSEEKGKIEETVAKRLSDEHHMQAAQREKVIQDLMRQLDEAKRKAEQGSQQLQGEVRELDLESLLRDSFPSDDIEPVAKGVRGADVLQRVRTSSGISCGTILWECKRTKNWSDGWIEKLRSDQREARAEIAVLVSDALPKDVDHFVSMDGIWVTSPEYAVSLAVALRTTLEQVARVQRATVHKEARVEALHRYLTGVEFRGRVEAMVGAVVALQSGLDKEKRATQARWKQQEKELEVAVAAIAGMYGDFRGLVGPSVQPVAALEMDDSGDDRPEPASDSVPAPPGRD